MLLFVITAHFYGQDIQSSAYILFGNAEELSEDDFLKLERLAEHPLDINKAKEAELAESGLFSAYQIASLSDYKSRHGALYSVTELALLDGFGEYFAKAVAPFITFKASDWPPEGKKRVCGSSNSRYQLKNGSGSWVTRNSLKYSNYSAGLAHKRGQSEPAWFLGWDKDGTKITAGNYNLRFGQGLVLWSGLTFSGVTSPLSLYKRGTGLSGSTSLNGSSQRGLAVQSRGGRLSATGFVSFPGKDILSGGNLSLLLTSGQIGITGYIGKAAGNNGSYSAISAEGRFCLYGKDIFTEIAFEPAGRAFAGVAGMVFPVGKGQAGIQARLFTKNYSGIYAGAVRAWSKTSDEAAMAFSLGYGGFSFSADYAGKLSVNKKQLKIGASEVISFGPALSDKILIKYRWNNYGSAKQRSEIRNDLCFTADPFKANLRLDTVNSNKIGLLSYLEGAAEWKDKGQIWLRGTIFMADNWDDRIYSYERDAPGGFLVPAYYGRGWAASILIKKKLQPWRWNSLTLYLRASHTAWWTQGKAPANEVRGAINFAF